jgi:beta-lactam-binding protein with PASTA domain
MKARKLTVMVRGLALAMVAVTLAACGGDNSNGPALISVPNVVGDTQAAATTAITGVALALGTVTMQSSTEVASGDVISESPAAGTKVASGSAVSIVISSGPAQVAVPDVVGSTQAAATTAITGAGLTVGTVTMSSSATVPSGSVISESPVATTSVASGSAVNLVVSSGPAQVAVPNVVASAQAAAATAITAAGLTVGTVTTASSSMVPSGSVISESPLAGTSVASGSAVNLVISSGPQAQVAVPNVVGSTQAVATTAISGAGLIVGSVSMASSATVASGSVIGESPPAGTNVSGGSAVNLVVSSGPAQVAVPNVVGSTQAAATAAITGAGLTVGTLTMATSATVASGNVISESPVAGTNVAKGSAVSLVVSSGAAQVAVPNVVGTTQAAATTAITGAGLTVGTLTMAASATVASGNVISESPVAGTNVAKGSAVNLVVSSGTAQVAVPNVVGNTQAAASTAITGAGLTVGSVTMATSATVASGSVISESPVAGTNVAKGSAVNLVVSSGAAQVAVPNVVGTTQAAASTAITGAGLTVGSVTMATSATVASGSVISENPAAGTSVASGSAVNLTVSTGTSNVSSGQVGASGVAIPLPTLGNFSGTLYVPPTVGGTASTLSIQLTTSLAALNAPASTSNLPAGAPLYITLTLNPAVTFSAPLNLTLTSADGTTYALSPFLLSGSTGLALGPPILGSAAQANLAPGTVKHVSGAVKSTKGSGATGITLGTLLPIPLLQAAQTPSSLVLIGHLGAVLGSYPQTLAGYTSIPTLAPGISVVMPQDGSNAIRIFPAAASGATAPFLIPQIVTTAAITAAYPPNSQPTLAMIQVDENGTVYALDTYNLVLFTWTFGSSAPPTVLLSASGLTLPSTGLSLESFAVNPQGTLIAALVRAGNGVSFVFVYNITAKTVQSYFQVESSLYGTESVNLAIDATGQVYYTDGLNAYVYAAGAIGSVTPAQTFSPSSVNTGVNSPQIGQLVIETTAAQSAIAGSIFAVVQSSTSSTGDVYLDSFYPASSGIAGSAQDLNTLNLVSTAGSAGWLQTGATGGGATFSVGAADYVGNLYLYSASALPKLSQSPVVEVFGSPQAVAGAGYQRGFWDSVTPFPASVLGSIATVPETVAAVAATCAAASGGTPLNQSYCATFSGTTDQLFVFTGQLNITTNAAGAISSCSYTAVGTVSGSSTFTTVPQTPCAGTISTSLSFSCGLTSYTGSVTSPAFQVAGTTEYTSSNQFCGTISSGYTTISGSYGFGEFGPGGGAGSGTFSTP